MPDRLLQREPPPSAADIIWRKGWNLRLAEASHPKIVGEQFAWYHRSAQWSGEHRMSAYCCARQPKEA